MTSMLIQTDGRSLAAVQAALQRLLQDVDARLFAVDTRRAILPEHLVGALDARYHAPAEGWLASLGIATTQALSDDEALALMAMRDRSRTPVLGARLVPRVAGLDWHLDCVRVNDAWQLLGGPAGIAWGDTRVAQIDTGYVPHAALGFGSGTGTWIDVDHAITDVPDGLGVLPLLLPEPGKGVDPLHGLSAGHGTRIGATISGFAPTAAGGAFYGTAPRVPHLPVRITDSVIINFAQREFARGLDAAVAWGAGVVNCSLSTFLALHIPEMKRAINDAYDAGVILICAAGNYGSVVRAPARWPRTVAVGGVTAEDRPWAGSCFGPEVDFSAPAADLRRAEPETGGYRGQGQGTSYATALATGAAALWLTHRRAELRATYGADRWKIPEAFRLLARQTARRPDGWQPGSHGDGILDIGALLRAPLPTALVRAPQA
jgi:hypothetical protein